MVLLDTGTESREWKRAKEEARGPLGRGVSGGQEWGGGEDEQGEEWSDLGVGFED